MTAYRIPGPLCASSHPTLDTGTLCLARSSVTRTLGTGVNDHRLHKRRDGATPTSQVPGLSREQARAALAKALTDALDLLQRRRDDMAKWDPDTEENFLAWFGTTDPAARDIVSKRIAKAIKRLERIKVDDFIPDPKPAHKRGQTASQYQDALDDWSSTFAYVMPGSRERGKYELTVHVGPMFATASEVTRAGTLIHELSHFFTVGDTDDVEATFPGDPRKAGSRQMYGYTKATRLSMQSGSNLKTNLALKNADNFEFFVERHDPADHPLDLDGAGDFPSISHGVL